MTFEEVRQALEGRMVAWSDEPVAFDGHKTPTDVEAAKSSRSPWCVFSIQHGTSDPATTAGIVLRPGSALIQVFTDDGRGTAPAMRIASSLAAHFEFYESAGLRCEAASVTESSGENGWLLTSVRIPWRVYG